MGYYQHDAKLIEVVFAIYKKEHIEYIEKSTLKMLELAIYFKMGMIRGELQHSRVTRRFSRSGENQSTIAILAGFRD